MGRLLQQGALVCTALLCCACSDLLGIGGFSGSDSVNRGDGDPPGAGGADPGGEGGGGPASGTQAWAIGFGNREIDSGRHVAVSTTDGVAIAGMIGDEVDFGDGDIGVNGTERMFVTRLDVDGQYESAVASAGTATVTIGGMDLDMADSTVVAGSYTGGTLQVVDGDMANELADPALEAVPMVGALFVAELMPDGTISYADAYFSLSEPPVVNDVAVSKSDGSVVVVGSVASPLTIEAGTLVVGNDTQLVNAFVARFNDSGAPSCVAEFGDSDGGMAAQIAQAVTIGEDGSIWVAGIFGGEASFGSTTHRAVGSTDIFLVKLDGNCGVTLSTAFGEGGPHDVGALAASPDGVIMTGSFRGTTTLSDEPIQSIANTPGHADIFVARYANDGAPIYSKSYGGTGLERGLSVAVDAEGAPVIGGSFSTEIEQIPDLHVSNGNQDALVLKLDVEGEFDWCQTFGRNDSDEVFSIALDGTESVVLTGGFVDGFTLGQDVVKAAGEDDIFVVKLNP